ncbi:GPI anchored serine-threonine rich family protein [Aspergillus clavatus NRRL 1]|uniref:Extracellular conserved serine-rich protein n=1 Tax=Aspergillus clavatus (strain ATCC 1007 / CBS 513.65 / DSM 816 / NCTC 3887 / NRRL 1 / QM 1276 / 107) TaxID=344612 RepID=A1CCW8_ASPCL|nr:extracellular conserved serine-rich protein [Aspergillus clavatus NRRL 1]EAW12375.1 extracellular conserved serine-rich protein [Aspergillus clavatus NRRL 1]
MRFTLTLLTALVGTAAAISITSPKKNEEVDLSHSTKVEWTTVNTDPSSFDIYLVKMNSYPPVNKLVGEDVKASDGSFTIQGVTAAEGAGYQINIVSNDPLNSGILAQSQQFNVSDSSASSSSSSSSSSKSSTATETSSSTSSTATSTGKATTTATDASSSTAASTTLSSTAASTHLTSSASTGIASSTGTATSKDKPSASSTASGTTSPSVTLSNSAGALAIPAGSILLGLAALAL